MKIYNFFEMRAKRTKNLTFTPGLDGQCSLQVVTGSLGVRFALKKGVDIQADDICRHMGVSPTRVLFFTDLLGLTSKRFVSKPCVRPSVRFILEPVIRSYLEVKIVLSLIPTASPYKLTVFFRWYSFPKCFAFELNEIENFLLSGSYGRPKVTNRNLFRVFVF